MRILPNPVACVLTLATLLSATAAWSQTVLSGDYSFNSRVCVGSSCVASEAYPASAALKIKQSNTRLFFEDTSSDGGGFAKTDWMLEANELSGTQEYFALRDMESDRLVFRIVGDAPENALFVAQSGNVGLGTSLPEGDLDIRNSAIVDLILHRDNSGGAPTSKWNINVGSTGLMVSDRVAFRNPLIIENGSPNSALHISDDGKIGMGASMPDSSLHILSSDGSAGIHVENATGSPSAVREMFKMANNGGSYFTLDNTSSGTQWFFVHENAAPNRFIITDGVADGPEMTVSAEGDLVIQGELFTAGSCAAGCDRVFDADYPLPTIPEQAAMMRDLKHLPNVGPTPEEGPFNITAITGGMLNELEKAHLYIVALNERLDAQTREMAELRALVESLQ